MTHIYPGFDLLKYIIDEGIQPGETLPSIKELADSDKLGGSAGKIREQLAVVRAMGLVDVRSRTGTQLKDFSFTPSVRLGLFYALGKDLSYFDQFSQLRTHIETAFWEQACACITREDRQEMRRCIGEARRKLNSHPIRIPASEHRRFHLMLFQQLNNPFVTGLLEAYWDAYDAVMSHHYMDLTYLQTVWDFHERILDAIDAGEYETAKQLFIEHTRLLRYEMTDDDPVNGRD